MNYRIDLDERELTLLMTALGKFPYEQVAEVYQKVMVQVRIQQTPAPAGVDPGTGSGSELPAPTSD